MPPCTEIIVRAAVVERTPAHGARGARGERELGGRAVAGPAVVVEQRAPVVELPQHLGQRVLDGLVVPLSLPNVWRSLA